jgi:hypothetical protein
MLHESAMKKKNEHRRQRHPRLFSEQELVAVIGGRDYELIPGKLEMPNLK